MFETALCTNAVIERSAGHDLLNRSDKQRLLTEAKAGSVEALEELIRKNQRLVIKIARMYFEVSRKREVEFGDYVQQGNIGLLRAIQKWDFARNVRFSTYAYYWIRQTVNRHHQVSNSEFFISVRFAEKMTKMRMVRSDLSNTLKREPTLGEIAEHSGYPATEVELYYLVEGSNVCLDQMGAKDRWAPDGNDYEGHGEIPVPTEENVEEDAFDRALVDQISAIAMKLSSQMQTIVCCRFGLNGHEEMTQLEIARQLGISRQAVADAENRALKKIKEALKVETL